MRILLLSARPDLRANARLAEAAGDLGIELQLIDAIAASALLIGGGLRPLGIDTEHEPPKAYSPFSSRWSRAV
jgi:hypothetical protein